MPITGLSVDLDWNCKGPGSAATRLTRVDFKTSSALQSQKWQLIGMNCNEINYIPWRIMWPSIDRDGEQLDPRCSTHTYHCPNQCTRLSPRSP